MVVECFRDSEDVCSRIVQRIVHLASGVVVQDAHHDELGGFVEHRNANAVDSKSSILVVGWVVCW